jgi:outer membrane protein
VVLAPLPGHAEQAFLPKWEVGMGVGALYAADYVGSDEYRWWASPLPYGVYRGKIWRVDRDGIRGQLFGTNRLKLDASFGFALPVRSDDNTARAGMPDLDAIIEVGPSLEWNIGQTSGGYGQWWFDNRVRAAFQIDRDEFTQQGWVYQSRIRYRHDVPRPRGYFSGQITASVQFADQRLQNYFYGVTPQYATPERPAYEAPGGYDGLQLTASGTRRIGRFWVGLFVRYDNLTGASYDDSPLVQTDSSWFVGIGLAWIFAQSKQRVVGPQR